MSLENLLQGQLLSGAYSLLGGRDELLRLFGTPLPELPPGEEVQGEGERIFIESPPELKENFGRYLQYLVQTVSKENGLAAGGRGAVSERAENDYADLLFEMLRHVVLSDRRQSLINLFWLVHCQEVAGIIKNYFSRFPRKSHLRYQIHPLLSGLCHRVEERVFSSFSRSQERMVRFQLGSSRNNSLVRSIMDDQLPITEVDLRQFDPDRILIPENRRFRISAAAFEGINNILRSRLEQGMKSGERTLLRILEEVSPGKQPSIGGDPRQLDRYFFQEPVLQYLLRDYDWVSSQLTRSKILKNEKRQVGSWVEFLNLYIDLVSCLRRAEVISLLRQGLVLTSKGLDDQKTREKYIEGRLYRFSRQTQIVSNIRTVTVLFADLRDFTRVSESAISERDLAAELYSIFDPASVIIRKFGGNIDKFLGDGLMATFGVFHRSGREPLAAVRAAAIMQQLLGRLRQLNRTNFQMGVSLHTGRVSVARFLHDELHDETTVIGRQVNIAGRLSSSKGAELELSEEEDYGNFTVAAKAAKIQPSSRTVGGVTIDADNKLTNAGIAVSGNFLEELKSVVTLEVFREEGHSGFKFYDRELHLWLNFEYVGEARFKGLEGTVSIYSLITAAPAIQ